MLVGASTASHEQPARLGQHDSLLAAPGFLREAPIPRCARRLCQ